MKNKKKVSNIVSFCLILLLSVAAGIFCGYAIADYSAKLSGGLLVKLLLLASGLLLMALAYLLQVLIHEAGHLVFGLISGYEFLSYRIGSFMLVKDSQGKLSIKRYSLAGTAGQCLMAPPDFEEDGYLPVGLYNMGGVLLNAVTAMLSFWAYYLSGKTVVLPMFFLCLGILGLSQALINALPVEVSGIPTDGRNALALGKDQKALRAFWIQLKINQYSSQGQRYRDMPEDWFSLSGDEANSGPLNSALAVFRANRFMDMQQFQDAWQLISQLLEETALPGLYQNLLKVDSLYLQALKGQAPQPEKSLEKFMKAMKNYSSVLRSRCALALAAGDGAKALEYRRQLEALRPSYPFSGELDSELELVELAEKALSLPVQ